MRDLLAVAAIAGALRQAHGDHVAGVMLQDGMTLAVLIDARLNNHDAARRMNVVL